MFRPAAAIIICSVLISCGRMHDAQQQYRIRASTALRQFMTEMQIAFLEQPPTNASDIAEWAKSFSSSSSNKLAKELHSVCEVVWMDKNVEHWLEPSNSSSNSAAIALVGQYQYEDRRYLIGVKFSGDVIQQNGPPESGFSKLDLQDAP